MYIFSLKYVNYNNNNNNIKYFNSLLASPRYPLYLMLIFFNIQKSQNLRNLTDQSWELLNGGYRD